MSKQVIQFYDLNEFNEYIKDCKIIRTTVTNSDVVDIFLMKHDRKTYFTASIQWDKTPEIELHIIKDI